MKAAANITLRWQETADLRQGTMCSEQQVATDSQNCVWRCVRRQDRNCREDYCHIVSWFPCHSWVVSICQGVPSGGQCSTTIVVGAADTANVPEIHCKVSWLCDMWVTPALNTPKGTWRFKARLLWQWLMCCVGELDFKALPRKGVRITKWRSWRAGLPLLGLVTFVFRCCSPCFWICLLKNIPLHVNRKVKDSPCRVVQKVCVNKISPCTSTNQKNVLRNASLLWATNPHHYWVCRSI